MDFIEKVYAGEYKNGLEYKDSREAYRAEDSRLHAKFMVDAAVYALEKGVPEKYVPGVLRHAWQSGHSAGYTDVTNHLADLIEIFT